MIWASSFVTTATSNSPAGQYQILPAFTDSANKLGNYLVTTNAGTLTVSPALLTVTADNQTRAYGQTNPPLTVQYSGFANGDDPDRADRATHCQHRGRPRLSHRSILDHRQRRRLLQLHVQLHRRHTDRARKRR